MTSRSPEELDRLRRAVEVLTAVVLDIEAFGSSGVSPELANQTVESTRQEGEQAVLELTAGLIHLCHLLLGLNLQVDFDRTEASELAILQTVAKHFGEM